MSSPAQNIIGSSEPGVAVPRQPRAPASGDAPPATNVTPYARLTLSGNPNCPNATNFVIPFDTASQDNLGNQTDTVNGFLICRVAGLYLVIGQMLIGANVTGIRALNLFKQAVGAGSGSQADAAAPGSPAASVGLNPSAFVSMQPGDYVYLTAWQNSGGALAISNTDTWLSFLRVG